MMYYFDWYYPMPILPLQGPAPPKAQPREQRPPKPPPAPTSSPPPSAPSSSPSPPSRPPSTPPPAPKKKGPGSQCQFPFFYPFPWDFYYFPFF